MFDNKKIIEFENEIYKIRNQIIKIKRILHSEEKNYYLQKIKIKPIKQNLITIHNDLVSEYNKKLIKYRKFIKQKKN